MARPAKYSVELILDAALALFVEGGPRAVSAAGVAKRLGAPNGSVYHRFGSRIALVAALWNRTVTRFQFGLYGALAHEDPREATFSAVHHVISWCAANPCDAELLMAGPTAIAPGLWPQEALEARNKRTRQLLQAVKTLSERLNLPVARVTFVLAVIPYTAVRRHLLQPDPVWGELALEAVRALLERPALPQFDDEQEQV